MGEPDGQIRIRSDAIGFTPPEATLPTIAVSPAGRFRTRVGQRLWSTRKSERSGVGGWAVSGLGSVTETGSKLTYSPPGAETETPMFPTGATVLFVTRNR